MMTTPRKHFARTCALPAIAAVLALSSTPIIAQEAQPVPSDPPPAATTPDEPAPDATASTPDSAAPAEAPAPAEATATSTAKRTARATHPAAAKPAPVATHTVTRTAQTHSASAAAAPAPVPAPPTTPTKQSSVSPVVDLNSQPKPAPAPATESTNQVDDTTLEMAAGGALALLVLGGGAAALASRRRRRRYQEEADEQAMAFEPFETAEAPEPAPMVHQEQPAIVTPSAFAWGNGSQAREEALATRPTVDGDDRRPGETWVERAYRGPTPNNPSVSLRNRLGRAAFFDKRERDVAAGTAEPVDMDAGLPDAMVEEREREPA